MQGLYFNNATTSWPKPDVVYRTMDRWLRAGISPGRTAARGDGVHADVLSESRKELADFFGIADPSRLAFTPGCTWALNLAIRGLPWREGDVVVMSGLEHHAVSRPVRRVSREHGVRFEIAPYKPGRPIDLDFVEEKLREGRVRLVACTMASNVTGDLFPAREVVALAHRHGALCLLDAAQTAGLVPVDVSALEPDLLAFPGHKGLHGAPGVGGLYVAPGVELEPLAEGGTGHDSGKHPMSGKMPSTFEVGTINLPPIAGLAAAVRWMRDTGLEAIRRHERRLTERLLRGLQAVPGARLFGTTDPAMRTSAVSMVLEGVAPKRLAEWLAERFGIASRAGYHCAPLAHETIGTLPGDGTIRFSPGYFNTEAEVDVVIDAVDRAAREATGVGAAA